MDGAPIPGPLTNTQDLEDVVTGGWQRDNEAATFGGSTPADHTARAVPYDDERTGNR
jgi:hypothetical protein